VAAASDKRTAAVDFSPLASSFFSFLMLGRHVPMLWNENWAHWRMAVQRYQHRQHQWNGGHQAVVPYPETHRHESSGTIRRDHATGIHLDQAHMDANDTRTSVVWRPPQEDLSKPVSDSPTDCVDSSEYEVLHTDLEDMGSMLISHIHPLSIHSLTTLCR